MTKDTIITDAQVELLELAVDTYEEYQSGEGADWVIKLMREALATARQNSQRLRGILEIFNS